MDPPALMSSGAYNLAEIWQYSVNESEARRSHFESGVDPFGDPNREIPGNDRVILEHRTANYYRGAEGCGVRRRRDGEDEVAAMGVSTSDGVGLGVSEADGKRFRTSGFQDENNDPKADAEPSSMKQAEQRTQRVEPPKQDYIHVRARRGQATDSHSLAERARREKISERMKILQDLVPGCNKVIGKALVLDEIINYIQSLQHQVEFLSMKLEAVNSRMNTGIEVFPPKDFGQQAYETAGVEFGSQATREYSRGTSPEWLHMQIGGGFERTT